MIEVIPARDSDLKYVLSNKKEDVYCSQELEYSHIKNHPFSVCLKDKNGATGLLVGMDIFYPGVAEGWAITTYDMNKYPIAYTKKMLTVVEKTMEHFNLHRLQIIVKCRSDLVRWALFLGFEIEGTMKQFGKDKADYYMMGRIR